MRLNLLSESTAMDSGGHTGRESAACGVISRHWTAEAGARWTTRGWTHTNRGCLTDGRQVRTGCCTRTNLQTRAI